MRRADALAAGQVGDGAGAIDVEPRRRQPADRLLDHFRLSLVERRDEQNAGFGSRHLRYLIQRHQRAVRLDLDRVQHARRRLAGTDTGKVTLRGLEGLLHPALCVLQNLCSAHETSVPTRSPLMARAIAPGV